MGYAKATVFGYGKNNSETQNDDCKCVRDNNRGTSVFDAGVALRV